MDTVTHLLPKFQSRLTTKIDTDDTSIVLESVTDIPTAPFMAILDDSKSTAECVWVTAVTVVTKTLTVTRAQRGTTGVEHVVGTLLFHSEIPLGDLGFFETWVTVGETGRPLESKLITDVLLGGWANGLKGYVDCNDTGGSVGLLSGVNGEIRLPDGAGRGAYFGLESEVVFQSSSTVTPNGSAAGFLYCGASGAGLADFQDNGVFMTVVGLTNEAGHVLSLDYHTLRCNMVVGGANLAKYLVLSLAENYISHSFSALAANGKIGQFLGTIEEPNVPDGGGLFTIQATVTGVAAGMVSALSSWVNITGDGAIGKQYVCAQQNGIYADAGGVDGDTTAIFGMRCHAFLDDAPSILAPLSLNTANRSITALFHIASGPSGGIVNGNPSTSVDGTAPLFVDTGGAVRWVHLFPGP